MRRLFISVGCTLLAAGGIGLSCAHAGPVAVDAKTQQRLDIVAKPLEASGVTSAPKAFVRVLDPAPLVALISDIDTQELTLQASQAEADRTKALNTQDSAVSLKVAQAAGMQAASDSLKLKSLKQRLGLEWGPGLARMDTASLHDLASALAAGSAALVRLDTPSGRGLAGLRSARIDLGANGFVDASVLGPARAADAGLKSPGVIAVVRSDHAAVLSSGLTTTADLLGSDGSSGVLIPSSALLRADGQIWVFIRTDAGHFDRRAIVGGTFDSHGLIVGSGFRPGEMVVVQGASALYTAETAPAGGKAAGDGDD